MKTEYLVVLTDGMGGFSYAHNEDLKAASKGALKQIGNKPHKVYKALAWEYPKEYGYTIQHFPFAVMFDIAGKADGVNVDLIRRVSVAVGNRKFEAQA